LKDEESKEDYPQKLGPHVFIAGGSSNYFQAEIIEVFGIKY
jgi:hypothetical protein